MAFFLRGYGNTILNYFAVLIMIYSELLPSNLKKPFFFLNRLWYDVMGRWGWYYSNEIMTFHLWLRWQERVKYKPFGFVQIAFLFQLSYLLFLSLHLLNGGGCRLIIICLIREKIRLVFVQKFSWSYMNTIMLGGKRSRA